SSPAIAPMTFTGEKAVNFSRGAHRMLFDQSTRRRFIRLLGSAAATASPLAVRAQQTATPAIGSLRVTKLGDKPGDLANDLDSLLQQAQALGAPMAAVQRAIQISGQPIFPKKDALAVFDISQPSATKRFYVLDLKSG